MWTLHLNPARTEQQNCNWASCDHALRGLCSKRGGTALLGLHIQSLSRFEDTDRFKGMLARRRKLHIRDVSAFQCHWLMAANIIALGEGGLLSESNEA